MLSLQDHFTYLRQALELARKSPSGPTNFRVGAVLVSDPLTKGSGPEVLATGYTLELPGNTHAEQCAISKLASRYGVSETDLHTVLTPEVNAVLYTTLEPCGKRLSGCLPCVHRLISTRGTAHGGPTPTNSKNGVRRVVFGAKEPGIFVKDNNSCRIMDDAGLEWQHVEGLGDEILRVAKEGHTTASGEGTNTFDKDEKRSQEEIPRNSKKRMMEVPPS